MDDFYNVRIKNDNLVLFVGRMWECEHWVHTNGKMGVTYEIETAVPLRMRKSVRRDDNVHNKSEENGSH